jgi:ketosteroid isomerase-like protein
MIKRIFFILLVAISVSTLMAQNKEEKELILEQVKLKSGKLSEFMKSSLSDSIASIFSPNCHFIPEHDVIYESRDEVLEHFTGQFKEGMKISKYALESTEFKVYDDIVLEIGVNEIHYTMLPEKKLYKAKYNYMFVWKSSKKGNYRIRAAIWNMPVNPCE